MDENLLAQFGNRHSYMVMISFLCQIPLIEPSDKREKCQHKHDLHPSLAIEFSNISVAVALLAKYSSPGVNQYIVYGHKCKFMYTGYKVQFFQGIN